MLGKEKLADTIKDGVDKAGALVMSALAVASCALLVALAALAVALRARAA